jgi:predicted PurR-regulated permease PerM
MALRKKRIVDRKFQLKTIFSIIGFTLCSFLILIAIVAVQSTHDNRKILKAAAEVNAALDREDLAVSSFLRQVSAGDASGQTQGIAALAKTHKETLQTVRTSTENIGSYIDRNFLFISGLLIVVIILSTMLYIYLLRLTHRIAGPVYVMSRHIQDILEDRKPEIRELRDKDELREFYLEFVALVEKFTQEDK